MGALSTACSPEELPGSNTNRRARVDGWVRGGGKGGGGGGVPHPLSTTAKLDPCNSVPAAHRLQHHERQHCSGEGHGVATARN